MRFTHTGAAPKNRNDLKTIKSLLPYIWQFKWRVIVAIVFLVSAKIASVLMPFFLKNIVDELSLPHNLLILPVAALLGYGFARLASGAFGELRDALFARVTQGSIRRIATQIFQHLLSLSLRFHTQRQTGGLSRDIERGTKGIGFLLNFMVFNILPTILEIVMVAAVLLWRYDWMFAFVTIGTIVSYILFTLFVTEKRMVYRRTMNTLDSQANSQAIDALLNYETVKYFSNETYEYNKYDKNLKKWVDSAVKNQVSLNFLNIGQSAIISVGVTLLLWLSSAGVINQTMSVGDVVLVSAYLTQLYAPLNFLGFVYREIKHSLADMERMFGLLDENQEVSDKKDAVELKTSSATIEFKNIDFSYEKNRQILFDLSFSIPAGKTVAVVGASGAGKSTLSRLLFRFYDVNGGSIEINGQNIKNISQASLRHHIGIVPQDTVLFNDSIYYNIAYGNPNASKEQIIQAAKSARIHDFVTNLPEGYDTTVGERGLKLSGGEKQRVAIARTLLKNPTILILDEATSALDSKTERDIQIELAHIARNRSTLIIAHRLSTIADADKIIVMDKGRIIEQGTHQDLLEMQGVYANMWDLQQSEQTELGTE